MTTTSSALSSLRRFIFLGAPGVGKGTFAGILAPKYGLEMITAGDIIRSEISQNTSLGNDLKKYAESGQLVPDQLVLDLVGKKLNHLVAEEKGFILDGFPRTVPQADALQKIVAIDQVINISLTDKISIEKIMGRRVCPLCKQSFNLAEIKGNGYDMPSLPPPSKGKCHAALELKGDSMECPVAKKGEINGLETRADDNLESVTTRFEAYHKETKPLIDYYKLQGILTDFDVKLGKRDAPR